MSNQTTNQTMNENPRRKFLGQVLAGTAAGITTLSVPFGAKAIPGSEDADEWFHRAKGKHRIVYDAPEPHEGMPFIWSWVYYLTNNSTGTPDNDMTVMVVLRHKAIPFAMEDRLWEKYKLGEMFNIKDKTTGRPALRNPYYIPREGDFPFPEVQGIQALQGRGAMFCVCDMALKVHSMRAANATRLDPEEVRQDWIKGILKDIQIVPSGVWAVGRAQEHGFGYCYAGG
jgi:intracellular sulfur oxidation DsrE/DsrF family protein